MVNIYPNINPPIKIGLQQRLIKRIISVLCFCLFFGILFVSCGSNKDSSNKESSNSIVAYFKDAEVQAETDEQRKQIKLVLSDLLNLKVDELKVKKYPNYQNNTDQWDVIKFLNSYFVPSSPQVLTADSFFEDLGKPEAKAAIQERINKIDGDPGTNADSTLQKK